MNYLDLIQKFKYLFRL